MVFSSIEFGIFFVIVYALYLFASHRWQNRILLVASAIFYGAWDWRFLFLLYASVTIVYFVGIEIAKAKTQNSKKFFLFLSTLANLAILCFFKYFNFFALNLEPLLKWAGISVNIHVLNLVLPVGISFYTFQAMSYTIDIYRGRLKPTQSYLPVALFVTFFPQLVAGPIERAEHLLPQVLQERKLRYDWFLEGLYLILWGLLEKVVVADNLAKIVDPIFAAPAPYDGLHILIALYAFAFQIYCDFAGYSNMARGLARLMGFDLMINFNLPYFSSSPRKFWQRWHISFSSWLRDYLYIPLGGNRKGPLTTVRNLTITMLLAGLWHGAAWTFVSWGAYHGFLLIIHRFFEILFNLVPKIKNVILYNGWCVLKTIFFFHLVCFGWLLFRAQSLSQVFQMSNALLYHCDFSNLVLVLPILKKFLLYVSLLITVQMIQFIKKDLFVVFRFKPAMQICFYLVMLYSILLLGVTTGEEFIYFQF